MNLLNSMQRRWRWLNLPTVSLLALLQRTPVVNLVRGAGDVVMRSPLGDVLKSATAIAATLGSVNTLVGATPLVPSSGSAAGTTVTVGSAVSIAFTVTPTQTPIQSWRIAGDIPPGLNFSTRTTVGLVNAGSLLLGGTATTAGAYTVSLQAFDQVNGAGFASAIYDYVITVNGGTAVAPSITTQPQSQTVTAGANVTFTIAVSGTPTPTLQWRKNGSNIAGQTGTSLVLNSVSTGSAGTYTVVATNSAGTATSEGAVLTVNPVAGPPPGTPASFGAYSSGATEVTASWLAPTSGAAVTGYKLERATSADFATGLTAMTLSTTSTSYVDTTVAAATTYFYRLSATNSSGASAATSSVSVKTLSSNGSGTSTFANISTRAHCQAGSGVTIGGVVITGSANKRILVRAIGPTLTKYGMSAAEVLSDPTLEVSSGGRIVATNDNLADNANAAEITTMSNTLHADTLLGSDTTSSALLLTLAPGAYSFLVKGKNDTAGTVLLEAYDTDTSQGTAKFVNISTRAFCTTGNGVTIGGFVISGSARKQVLVRAVGPTLTSYGLGANEVLADPVIELHDAVNNNALIATNDNVAENANAAAIVTTSARIGASALALSDVSSSALLLTLPPGVYSFIAQGKSAAPNGILIVEVYDAD